MSSGSDKVCEYDVLLLNYQFRSVYIKFYENLFAFLKFFFIQISEVLRYQKAVGCLLYFRGYFCIQWYFLGCRIRARLEKLIRHSSGPPFLNFLVDMNMTRHKTFKKCP